MDLTDTGADQLLNNGLPAALYCQWHTGAPGTAGTANVAPIPGRRAMALDTTRNRARVIATNVESPAATGATTITHVSFWNADTGGACHWTGQLAAPVVLPQGSAIRHGPGGLGVGLDASFAMGEAVEPLPA